MLSFTEENHLKAIFHLSIDEKIGVSTNAIAQNLNTKAPSVTDMLKKLRWIDQTNEAELKIRLKSDVVFRDTALMLMRRFDKLLQDRLESAEDHQIFKIADTRSGKAFLVVGKISDAF